MKRLVSAFITASMLAFALPLYAEMPPDVLAEVRASIEARYPDNYSMQKSLIDNQNEAYDFLQTYAPPEVPSDVLERIKNSIISRYPNNFSMQKSLIENQVKSYLELNK